MLTKSQLKKRHLGIGGSDAAAVNYKSKYKTAVEVFKEKTDEEFRLKRQEEIEGRLEVQTGKLLEKVVIGMYERETGERVRVPRNTFVHPDHNFIIGNVDGLTKDKIIEVKVLNYRRQQEFGDEGTDEMPDDYLFQCAHYAAVLGIKTVELVVSFLGGCNGLKRYVYHKNEKNKKFEQRMVKREVEFWNDNVLANVPPNAICCSDVLAIYPRATVESKEANEDILMQVLALKKLKDMKKEHEEAIEGYEAKIKNYIADAKELRTTEGDLLCSWKDQERNGLDGKRLKIEMPEIYDKYCKSSISRVFRVK